MLKPTLEETQAALEAANAMQNAGIDSADVGRCLLYFHERNLHLERVYAAVERYLHSGLAEREHAQLLKLLEQARDSERHWTHEDDGGVLGL